MNSILHHFKKLLILTFFLFTITNMAQTPQYYNYNTTGIPSGFPFAVPCKVQSIFPPGDFNHPSGAPSGIITSLSVMMAGNGGPCTYTNLLILVAVDNWTQLPPGSFYSGQMDTVYKRSSVTISSAAGQWLTFALDVPHYYDSTQSLIVQIECCGASNPSGMLTGTTTTTNLSKAWSHNVQNCIWTYDSSDVRVLNMGINVTHAPQYYNYKTTTWADAFPFGQHLGKMVQWLFLPGDFNQPTMARSGNITSISIMMAIYGGPGTFTNLFILVGQDTITALPNNNFYTGQMDTVYKRSTITLSCKTGEWLPFIFDRPHSYDSTKSLIVQIEQCGENPNNPNSYLCVGSTMLSLRNRRSWNPFDTPCPWTFDGRDSLIVNMGINVVPVIGINNQSTELPKEYELKQNYPNPFNPDTKIEFSIPKSSNVELKIYDVLGREVATLVNDFKQAGNYSVDFKGDKFASGVYFYTLRSGNFVETKKMVLIK